VKYISKHKPAAITPNIDETTSTTTSTTIDIEPDNTASTKEYYNRRTRHHKRRLDETPQRLDETPQETTRRGTEEKPCTVNTSFDATAKATTAKATAEATAAESHSRSHNRSPCTVIDA